MITCAKYHHIKVHGLGGAVQGQSRLVSPEIRFMLPSNVWRYKGAVMRTSRQMFVLWGTGGTPWLTANHTRPEERHYHQPDSALCSKSSLAGSLQQKPRFP